MTEKKVDESWKEEVSREKQTTKKEGEKFTSKQAEATQESGFPPMQASFGSLLAELAMQASLFLGEIPDPQTNQPIEDLNRARYLIDELGVLEQKTAGNLTQDEERALKSILYELRMKYVRKVPKP